MQLPFFVGNTVSSFMIGLLLIFTGVYCSSCAVSKKSYYFKTLDRDTILTGFVSDSFESKIQKKDVLAITISSLNKELDERFNAGGVTSSTQLLTNSTGSNGYLVDDNGEILVHHIGKIVVEGLTRRQLQEKLQNDLVPYMKEPIVNVQYLNHKVTVLGEVSKPQVLNMPEEKFSLLDVIVLSGDLKESASRTNITVIRDSANVKLVKHINLESTSVFTSPFYYVKPDDIIYILPEKEKYAREERRRNLQTTLSLVASGVSLLIIVLNTILR